MGRGRWCYLWEVGAGECIGPPGITQRDADAGGYICNCAHTQAALPRPPPPSLLSLQVFVLPPTESLSLSPPLSYPPPHHQPAASTPTLKARRSAVVVFVGGHLLRVRVSELHVTAGGFNTSYIRERLVCTGTRLGHAFFGDLRWAWRSIKGPMALCFSLLHYAFSLDKTTPPSFNCLKTAFIFVDSLSVTPSVLLLND